MKKIIALMLAAVCMLAVFSGCTAGTLENEGGEALPPVTDSEQTKSKYPMVSETLLVSVYEKTLYIADSKGNIHTETLAEGLVKKQLSLDGSKLMAVAEDTWTLLYFDGEELKAIADDVYSSAMSADGRVIAYTMPGSTGDNDDLYRYKVSVPDLVGQNYDTLPDYSGITVCRQSSAYSDEYARGEIIDQYPNADTEVVSGTRVFVVVSLDAEPTEP